MAGPTGVNIDVLKEPLTEQRGPAGAVVVEDIVVEAVDEVVDEDIDEDVDEVEEEVVVVVWVTFFVFVTGGRIQEQTFSTNWSRFLTTLFHLFSKAGASNGEGKNSSTARRGLACTSLA